MWKGSIQELSSSQRKAVDGLFKRVRKNFKRMEAIMKISTPEEIKNGCFDVYQALVGRIEQSLKMSGVAIEYGDHATIGRVAEGYRSKGWKVTVTGNRIEVEMP
jgi:hypothetical protein